MKINKDQLNSAVEFLNKISRRRYRIDSAYGGHKLVVSYEDTSGISDVSYGYVSKSECYCVIWAIIRYHVKESRDPTKFERLVSAGVSE